MAPFRACFIFATSLPYTQNSFSQDIRDPILRALPAISHLRRGALTCRGLSWIAIPCDQGNTDPSWMNMPTSNMVAALTARLVSEDYVEWGWFLFGLGVLLWLALWPITFRAVCSECLSVPKHFRSRVLKTASTSTSNSRGGAIRGME